MKTLTRPTNLARMALFTFVLMAASAARASVYTVDTLEDLVDDDVTDGVCHTVEGTCSLRAATMQANNSGEQSAYIDIPAGTYTLSIAPTGSNGEDTGDLDLRAGPLIVIRGEGAATTVLDGNQLDRVVFLQEHATANISGITIRNGLGYSGGAVFVSPFATLAITDSVVENNVAVEGGGISSVRGVLGIVRCTLRSNQAIRNGGGVLASGILSIDDSMIEGNSSDSGGGIYSRGSLDILRSTIRSNVSTGDGGGLYALSPTTIHDTALYGNRAMIDGGGIAYRDGNDSSYLYVVNSTVSENSAGVDGGGIYVGYAYGNTFIYNTTLVHNKANSSLRYGGTGGGIYFKGPVADLNSHPRFALVNTLMARNSAGFDTNNDCVGSFEAYGRNFVGDPTSPNCRTSNARLFRVTPGTIGPLRDNGGPTLTNALLRGSEAIDSALSNLGCVDWTGEQLPTDQRGAPRPASIRYCDAGAFEYGALPPEDLGP